MRHLPTPPPHIQLQPHLSSDCPTAWRKLWSSPESSCVGALPPSDSSRRGDLRLLLDLPQTCFHPISPTFLNCSRSSSYPSSQAVATVVCFPPQPHHGLLLSTLHSVRRSRDHRQRLFNHHHAVIPVQRAVNFRTHLIRPTLPSHNPAQDGLPEAHCEGKFPRPLDPSRRDLPWSTGGCPTRDPARGLATARTSLTLFPRSSATAPPTPLRA